MWGTGTPLQVLYFGCTLLALVHCLKPRDAGCKMEGGEDCDLNSRSCFFAVGYCRYLAKWRTWGGEGVAALVCDTSPMWVFYCPFVDTI